MENYTKQDILKLVEEEDVEFIRLQFTDVFGTFKNIAVTASQLEKALDHKIVFDGAAIDGFAQIEESDMYLHPDLNTFAIFPWRPQQGKVARLICDVYRSNGQPFEGDCRQILKRAVERANSMGYEFYVGPECEFFLYHMDNEGQPTNTTTEKAGYFEISPVDFGENARRDMVLTLEEMGFEVLASYHEKAPAQHEIDFRYDKALNTADNIMTFKMAVKTIARRHGLHATFMPKPRIEHHGSGMHTHMSLFRDGKNVFDDPQGELGLSEEAYYFIGGLLKHCRSITAIANPLINSYKRLTSGYDAPQYIAWSENNRSSLIRIPFARGVGSRIELRSPDPSANPYLMIAVCLEAGMDGIRNKIVPPKLIRRNIFTMTQREREAEKIESMPLNLDEALREMRKDPMIREVLGDHIFEKYAEAKEKEWNAYTNFVTDWEIEQYLYKI